MAGHGYRFVYTDNDRFYIYESPQKPGRSWREARGEAYAAYRRQWDTNYRNNIVGDFPLNIDFELTSRCNLRCPYCRRTILAKAGGFQAGDMDFDLLTRLLAEANGRLAAAKLNIRGEPLLYPRVVDAVRLCKEAGVTEVIMNTNGTLATPEMGRKLLDAGLDTIIFSLDSTDKATFEAGRPGASFDTVVENVRALADYKRKTGLWQVKIRANTFFKDDIEASLQAFWNLWGEAIDEFTMSRLNPTAEATAIDFTACADVLPHVGWQCPQLWQRLGVFCDGTVIMCCTDFDGEAPVGNVRDQTIAEIWHSPALDTLRALHRKGEGYKVPFCRKCHNHIFQVIRYYDEVLNKPYPRLAERP